ncbi:ATP-dependent DNA helicase RecQ-like, partial [Saccoglossus kowalevskii]
MNSIKQAIVELESKLNIQLKSEQKRGIASLYRGEDALIILPTGFGKSLIYSLAPKAFNICSENSGSIILVISPLISLMVDQVKRCLKYGISAALIGSAQHDHHVARQVRDGECQVVFASPEAILSRSWRKVLISDVYQRNLIGIAIDEAHCVDLCFKLGGNYFNCKFIFVMMHKYFLECDKMYDCIVIFFYFCFRGNDFRRDFMNLKELRSLVPPYVPMTALTATATSRCRQAIINSLGLSPTLEIIEATPNRPNIFYSTIQSDDVMQSLRWLVEELQEKGRDCRKVLIYCRSIKS